MLLPASEKGGSEDPEGSGAPGAEERQAGRQTQFPKPWTWASTLDGRVRVPRVTPAGYARLGSVLSPSDFAVGIFSAN